MRNWPWFLIIAITLFFGLLTFLIWWYIHPTNNSERKDFVQLLTQIIGGAVLLIGLFFTWRNMQITQETTSNNLKNTQETLRISQEGQITERFTKAIDQLGSKDSLAVRVGGVYALERISRDSERDHGAIMEILTAFVRENANWDENKSKQKIEALRTPADIQAILTVVGRRTRTCGKGEGQPLYLASADLRSTHLEQAHLEGAILWNAHLEGAVLYQARLEGARLTAAFLRDANLKEAHLEGALLSVTFMERANLSGAFFKGAFVDGVSLEGADLSGAHLEGIDLRTASGLTWEQLKVAHMDDETKLPSQVEKLKRTK